MKMTAAQKMGECPALAGPSLPVNVRAPCPHDSRSLARARSARSFKNPADGEISAPPAVEIRGRSHHDGPDYRVHHDAAADIRSPRGVFPPVEGVAVLEPSARKHRPADEVGQPGDFAKVTGRCEVIILAVYLTRLIGAKAKWRTQRELVVRQGRSTPRAAPAASDKQPIRFAEAPEMVGLKSTPVSSDRRNPGPGR